MLTVEYRVNGQLIGFTNIRNSYQVGEAEELEFMYEYEHRPAGLNTVCSGTVTHKQKDGFEKLVLIVMKAVERKIGK